MGEEGEASRLARIETNVGHILKSQDEMKGDVKEIKTTTQARETYCAQQSVVLSDASKDIEKLDERVGANEKSISKLITPVRVVKWIGAAVGLTLIGFIWALLTGQAEMVFP